MSVGLRGGSGVGWQQRDCRAGMGQVPGAGQGPAWGLHGAARGCMGLPGACMGVPGQVGAAWMMHGVLRGCPKRCMPHGVAAPNPLRCTSAAPRTPCPVPHRSAGAASPGHRVRSVGIVGPGLAFLGRAWWTVEMWRERQGESSDQWGCQGGCVGWQGLRGAARGCMGVAGGCMGCIG